MRGVLHRCFDQIRSLTEMEMIEVLSIINYGGSKASLSLILVSVANTMPLSCSVTLFWSVGSVYTFSSPLLYHELDNHSLFN